MSEPLPPLLARLVDVYQLATALDGQTIVGIHGAFEARRLAAEALVEHQAGNHVRAHAVAEEAEAVIGGAASAEAAKEAEVGPPPKNKHYAVLVKVSSPENPAGMSKIYAVAKLAFEGHGTTEEFGGDRQAAWNSVDGLHPFEGMAALKTLVSVEEKNREGGVVFYPYTKHPTLHLTCCASMPATWQAGAIAPQESAAMIALRAENSRLRAALAAATGGSGIPQGGGGPPHGGSDSGAGGAGGATTAV